MTAVDLPSRLRALAERLTARDPAEGSAEVERAAAALEAAVAALPPALPPGAGRAGSRNGEGSPGTAESGGGGTGGTGQPGAPIRIWCDGSCSPNPGAGGWGTIVERDGIREELSGAAPDSTNNIMEMTAAIEGLRRTLPGSAVHVTTDSQYLVNGATKWMRGWKRKGWRKADGEPVLNRELWETLDGLLGERRVTWKWVRGHAGHPENERCDALANAARERLQRGGG